jgi:uncharacterized protein (DUF433 family)
MTKLEDLTTAIATGAEDAELVAPSDARAAFLSINPNRLGGTPVFKGTRVPVRYLFEYLGKGKSLETFLDDFDGVPRDEALAALQMSCEKMMEGLPRL